MDVKFIWSLVKLAYIKYLLNQHAKLKNRRGMAPHNLYLQCIKAIQKMEMGEFFKAGYDKIVQENQNRYTFSTLYNAKDANDLPLFDSALLIVCEEHNKEEMKNFIIEASKYNLFVEITRDTLTIRRNENIYIVYSIKDNRFVTAAWQEELGYFNNFLKSGYDIMTYHFPDDIRGIQNYADKVA